MAENFHFLARNCLEWKTESPLSDSPRKSPIFSFLGIHWYFCLTLHGDLNFDLHLESVEKKAPLNKDAKLAVFISSCRNGLTCLKSASFHFENVGTQKLHILTIAVNKYQDLPRYYTRWIVHCIFSTDLPSELLVNGSEAMLMPNLPDLKGQHIPIQTSIVMKAKLEANAPDDSLSDVENLCLDFGKLLEQKFHSDVTLTCGGRSFSAHRNILAARSAVFAAMFQNKMVESKSGSIDITDIDSEAFELLLKYVYTGKISDLSVVFASRLYIAADKYSVQSLKKKCSKWMLENLSEENCLDFLILADTLNDEMLKDKLINFAAKILELLEGDAWQKFSDKHPKLAFSVYQKRVFTKPV